MKIQTLTILLATLFIASCSGGGGGSNSNNDQTNDDPTSENDNDTSTPNARVTCLLNKLGTLPEDKKKVIELSARAVIACKATETDVKTFLGKRKK